MDLASIIAPARRRRKSSRSNPGDLRGLSRPGSYAGLHRHVCALDACQSGPMSSIGLVLDCRDPEKLASFWSVALDYIHVGMFGQYAALLPDGKPGPKLLLQQVAEPRSGKNRMHLDIETPDIEAKAAELVGLGATRLDATPLSEQGATWIRMQDPEGNEFCVCQAG
jgi:predicted enzyme related to lactoylglutathione lyase